MFCFKCVRDVNLLRLKALVCKETVGLHWGNLKQKFVSNKLITRVKFPPWEDYEASLMIHSAEIFSYSIVQKCKLLDESFSCCWAQLKAWAFHFCHNYVYQYFVSQAIHDAEAVLAHAQRKAEASKEALAQVQLLATCIVFLTVSNFHLLFSLVVRTRSL